MLREREKKVLGKRLFWCSAFATYIQAGRCKAERKVGRGQFVMMKRAKKRRGSPVVPLSGEEVTDMKDVIRQRSIECLKCPGVVKRSLVEQAAGSLS